MFRWNITLYTYREFYPFYLGEHANRLNRLFHLLGTSASVLSSLRVFLALIPFALVRLGARPDDQIRGLSLSLREARNIILRGIGIGYGCAWIGHFFVEKNRPATFKVSPGLPARAGISPPYRTATDDLLLSHHHPVSTHSGHSGVTLGCSGKLSLCVDRFEPVVRIRFNDIVTYPHCYSSLLLLSKLYIYENQRNHRWYEDIKVECRISRYICVRRIAS
jgi:hypothetical protein